MHEVTRNLHTGLFGERVPSEGRLPPRNGAALRPSTYLPPLEHETIKYFVDERPKEGVNEADLRVPP
jgi:hypothetical protein